MDPHLGEAHASTSSLLTYLLAGGLIFSLGFARAVWVRAKRDYKTTKAAVKPLRKAMWQSIWQTVKLGTLAVIVAVALLWWVGHDVRQPDETEKTTPAKIATSPSRR